MAYSFSFIRNIFLLPSRVAAVDYYDNSATM